MPTLGRYQLLERLRSGGMAEVFLARATGLDGFERLVALKCLLPQFATDGERVRMFLDEARLMARLHHANVVAVHELGQDRGIYFFAMDWVPGVDAHHLIERGGLPLEAALHVAIAVAEGLHHAHEQLDDFVHRDVSPSNVLVGRDGSVRLIDFGIARHGRVSSDPAVVRGKVAYLSPEQKRDGAVDRRSDVYALGVVVWELVAGEFLNERSFENSRLPPALTALVTRCLRADPAERYPTARAVADALAAVARSLGVAPSAQRLADHLERILPPPARQADASTMTESVITCELSRLVALPALPTRRRRRAPIVAALAAVVLLAAAWALRPVALPPPKPPVASTTPPPSLAVVEPIAVEKPMTAPPPQPIVHRKKAPPRPHRDWDGDSMLPP